jgi:hypothetical protein
MRATHLIARANRIRVAAGGKVHSVLTLLRKPCIIDNRRTFDRLLPFKLGPANVRRSSPAAACSSLTLSSWLQMRGLDPHADYTDETLTEVWASQGTRPKSLILWCGRRGSNPHSLAAEEF